MSRKDVPNELVCKAYDYCSDFRHPIYPYDLLTEWTGEPEKVCYRAMERAEEAGLIEYGVSLRCGWLTEKGRQLLAKDEGGSGD
jgi:hypothetical protein